YGLAADISEVGGTPIFGHQQPGGVTERAVRDVLLLPPGLMPKQFISLLGLGGPSFPLANHYDHLHIGYQKARGKPGFPREPPRCVERDAGGTCAPGRASRPPRPARGAPLE